MVNPISLTGLTLIMDTSLARNEVRLHPAMVDQVRKAFLEADMIRSIYQSTRVVAVVHPFSSVGSDEDTAA